MLLSLLSRRSLEADSRDAYGFTIRPQHLKRYQEYGHIYTEEEEERCQRWNDFLEQCGGYADGESSRTSVAESKNTEAISESCKEGGDSSAEQPMSTYSTEDGCEREASKAMNLRPDQVEMWIPIRSYLALVDKIMCARVKKKVTVKDGHIFSSQSLHNDMAECSLKQNSESDESSKCKEVDASVQQGKSDIVCQGDEDNVNSIASPESFSYWKELESLVCGGVPKFLRGELWQAFVGVTVRRLEGYYQNLISSELGDGDKREPPPDGNAKSRIGGGRVVPENLKKQIEKDLNRTFPGHPALNEEGRNSLRRVLIAYARHNPSVGYCQAMNFFAGLFLLLMPEENAFWTLVGVIDDYFDGYYSSDMIESQVDQLVFEELMRQTFPKLVNHLDYLGVQVTWISSPWFLSIFMNMLPWESVIRVWDVLLFEGNRVMLFRTALALMELYGPSLTASKDAGDAITLLQSLAGSTFDSSQLVITACMGFLSVTEDKLQALRNKHRPSVLGIIEETRKGSQVSKESKSIATKLYSFKRGPQGGSSARRADRKASRRNPSSTSLSSGTDTGPEEEPVPDLQEQVVLLKVEICNLLEEKRIATLRAEELETALMEMVKQDNRRLLSARVEELEQEVARLKELLADKQQQEKAMLKVLMHMEQEQKITEDARIAAEKEADNLRDIALSLQEKYEKAVASLAHMEERVILAESTLEATIQYETGQAKASTSPHSTNQNSPSTARKTDTLSFGKANSDEFKRLVLLIFMFDGDEGCAETGAADTEPMILMEEEDEQSPTLSAKSEEPGSSGSAGSHDWDKANTDTAF